MENNVLIRLEQVKKFYNMGELTVEALKESDLEVLEGELLVILGPSGSGKSTVLNLLGGMDSPSGGHLFFKQSDLSQANEQTLTCYRRNEVGFVFQNYNLIPDLTAGENVALAAELVSKPLPVDEVLEAVGLADRKHHFIGCLSMPG